MSLNEKIEPMPQGSTRQRQLKSFPSLPPVASINESFVLTGRSSWFGRNVEIHGEGEPSTFLYKLVSGYVRTFKTLNDGRRRIEAFYIPGDAFGLDTRSSHNVTAQAITRCKIELIVKKSLMARAITEIAVVNHLLALTRLELRRANSHNLQLLKSAQERIIGFLLDMEERQGSNREIDLPMTRGDIADHLGLTTETVSRMLWKLESIAAIAIPKRRRVVLRNVAALRGFSV
jgi:CRP/FNR family nitrogen fixation transcriptional regulator